MPFNISRPVPGSDAPAMTFPVYPLPSGMVLMPVSCSAQTILAPNQIKSNSTLLRIIVYNNISKIVIKNTCNIYA